MAWANIRTYNLLNVWQKRLNVQNYSFNQVSDGYEDYSPNVWVQQERNELAQTLMQEFEQFKYWTGFYPFPVFDSEIIYLDSDKPWYAQPIRTDASKIVEFGKEATEFLGTANVTYSSNKATVIFNSEEVDGNISLVFTSSDSNENSGDLRYVIPTEVSFSSGNYTFLGLKGDFVKPIKQSEYDSFVGGDPNKRNQLSLSDSDNFASTVDVYRVYTDTTVKAELLSSGTDSDTITVTTVNPVLRNGDWGEFVLTTNSLGLSSYPYAVKIYYKAGWELTDNKIFSPFETILIRRAKVNMPIDVKELSFRTSAKWQDDSKSIFESQAPNYYANPVGDRVIDYRTWEVYRTYHMFDRGQARRFV